VVVALETVVLVLVVVVVVVVVLAAVVVVDISALVVVWVVAITVVVIIFVLVCTGSVVTLCKVDCASTRTFNSNNQIFMLVKDDYLHKNVFYKVQKKTNLVGSGSVENMIIHVLHKLVK
jgi:hypothetical protein